MLAVIDTRVAEARGVDLQQAERAVPSGKWVLSHAPPRFQVKKVVSIAPSELSELSAVSVCFHSLLCWVLLVGARASQSHFEGRLL